MRVIDEVREAAAPPLNEGEMDSIRSAQQTIVAALACACSASITFAAGSRQQTSVELPLVALNVISQVLTALAEGRSLVLIPATREMTTVEAARLLGVSRPFLIKEMEAGRLKYHKVGAHRRIALEDLRSYAEQMQARQYRALERMTVDAQELGLDY
jgi:excisionase family DNA binding protein